MAPLVRHPERFLLFRRLARELRYRALPDVIDTEIVLTSAGIAASSARTWLTGAGLRVGGCRHGDAASAVATLAKYDLVDIAFDVPRDSLDHAHTRTGVPLLRDLNLLTSHSPSELTGDPEDDFAEDIACLETLVADLDEALCVARVFLQSVTTDDRRDPARMPLRIRGELPPGYFPRKFRVTDACVSNAPGAWLGKHLYL